jgi:hypothetical protein
VQVFNNINNLRRGAGEIVPLKRKENFQSFPHLRWQPALSAPMDAKGLSGAVANRQS